MKTITNKKKKKRKTFVDHLKTVPVSPPQMTPMNTIEEPTSMLRSILTGGFKSFIIEGWEHEDDD